MTVRDTATGGERAIHFLYQRTCTLSSIWFDEGWYADLIEEGNEPEEALRVMLRMAWEEDWSSVVEEMTTAEGKTAAEAFVDSVTSVRLVEVPS